MQLPVIRGVIDRRILINYRVDPDILEQLLPAPFRPQLVQGYGLAGICLIRLREVRPRGLPAWLGLTSENVAHRVAVEWNEGDQTRVGVYVLRRDTDSGLNALAGGRVFPGLHRHGKFRVQEDECRFEVGYRSDDGQVAIEVAAETAPNWPSDSIFASMSEASSFFAAGSLGYSPANQDDFKGWNYAAQRGMSSRSRSTKSAHRCSMIPSSFRLAQSRSIARCSCAESSTSGMDKLTCAANTSVVRWPNGWISR